MQPHCERHTIGFTMTHCTQQRTMRIETKSWRLRSTGGLPPQPPLPLPLRSVDGPPPPRPPRSGPSRYSRDRPRACGKPLFSRGEIRVLMSAQGRPAATAAAERVSHTCTSGTWLPVAEKIDSFPRTGYASRAHTQIVDLTSESRSMCARMTHDSYAFADLCGG